MVVNSALVVLKLAPASRPANSKCRRFVPVLGILVNATLIVSRLTSGEGGFRAPLIAGAIVVAATLLYFVLRPKNITDEALATLGD